MGRRGVTGTVNLPKGVVQKGGSTYRRFKVKGDDGKWRDHYVKLPDPLSPLFAEALARANGAPEKVRTGWPARSIGALIVEFRPVLASRKMADETRRAWFYYLGLIEEAHGTKLVADLRKSRVFKLRDDMADTPGKANAFVSKLRALLDFAVERDWIQVNPAAGVPRLDTAEHDPWPADVLAQAIEKASPMLRLAIVSGLYSGQRISDLIRMQHGWMKDGVLEIPASKKTSTYTPVPVDPVWAAEMKRVPRKAVTLLYDRAGKPFIDTDRLQSSMRRLMRSLGYVVRDKQGRPLDKDGILVTGEAGNQPDTLYSFHGLGKNACCYLTELGLSDTEISRVTGKTPETVRYYAKNALAYKVALGAAKKIAEAGVSRLVGKPE